MSRWSRTFPKSSIAFGAYNDAVAYLKARGFSVGTMEQSNPVAVMLGDVVLAKWSKLSPEDLEFIHGRIESHDYRCGPVTVSIRPDAPNDVLAAVSSEEAEGWLGDELEEVGNG